MRILSTGAAAFCALLLTAACGGSDDSAQTASPLATVEASASPDPSASPAPSATPSLPPLTPFGEELSTRLHAIRDKVSEIRGLPIQELAQEGVATPEDLRQYNVNQFAALKPDDAKDAQNSLTAMRYLKLVPDDYTLEGFAGDYSGVIAGFYDFNQKALVLVGHPNEAISKIDELTLAHEYTHSLEDGTFNLDALEKKYADYQQDKDGYSSYDETVECLIEGDATFTEIKYAEEMFGPDWRNVIQDPSATEDARQSALPEFIQRAVGFDYSDCEAFVSALYDEGGWDAVNAAFENPPATTEQVIDITKYHANELANGMMPADLTKSDLAGWTSNDLGQFGMFDTYNYILTLTGDPLSAYTSAAGWGSGWIRTYQDETGSPKVAQVYISFESNDDLLEFVRAFDKVMQHYGVDTSTLDPSGVKHFTIAGTTPYYGAIAEGFGAPVVELLVSPDEATLIKATAHFAPPTN
jgi:hypothetical protein